MTQHDGPAHAAFRPGRAAERGFTLLEALVAFLIAAMAVAAVVRAATRAVAATRAASQYEEAVARAQSHLAVLSAVRLAESDRQGDEAGGFHWRVRIAAAAAGHVAGQFRFVPAGALTLYRLTVTISWREDGRSRAVRLDSARLGPVT